jgi:hypothetical protein
LIDFLLLICLCLMPLSTIFNAILVLDTSNPKANQNRAVICTWDDVTEESRNNHRLKGALDAQPQVIKFTNCLPMVGGSLRVLRLWLL